ncbi:MAG: T9SS type A sorting domain-containing protein [Saprospiraceae bacterium]|nr:T9SS type A sorting domain-containing protein [Saprospiraceae bacterium]
MGFDANSIEGNPLIDNNLHLQSGSPAINAGQNSPATRDYDTYPRSGSFDIGADEFGNGTALQVPPPNGAIGTGADGSVTATFDLFDEIKMTIYPNPASQEIQVEMADMGQVIMTLYDKNGRAIKQVNGLNMAINGLPAGIYYLNVKTSIGEGFKPVLIIE